MKHFFPLVCLIYCADAFTLQAQNKDSVAIRRYYEENAILWTGSQKYYKNNQAYPIKNLKQEITFSKEASWEYAQFRKNNNAAVIGLIVTEALLISFILVKNRNVQWGLLAGSVVGFAFTLPLANKARTHLSRSIWAYNRDILLR